MTSKRAWLLVAVVLLGGCARADGATSPPGSATPPQPEVPGIVGNWVFVDGTSGGAPIPRPTRGRATLDVDATRLSGTAFCNGYGARYGLDGDRILVDDLTQTVMGCLDDSGAAEGAFLVVLAGDGTVVRRTADGLTLRNARGTLHFRPRSQPPRAASGSPSSATG